MGDETGRRKGRVSTKFQKQKLANGRECPLVVILSYYLKHIEARPWSNKKLSLYGLSLGGVPV